MIRTTRTLVDVDRDQEDIKVEIYDHGKIDLTTLDVGEWITLSKSQASALRDALNEHFASPPDDDALATLDRELRGNPMGERHAVVPGVPVAVRTTGMNGGRTS